MILDYLRVVHQPDNNDALARIINVPKRNIGDQSIKNLLEEAERNSMSLWKLLIQHCRGIRTAKTTIRKQAEQKISVELIRLVEGIRNRLRSTDGSPINLVEVIEKLISDLHLQDFLEETYAEQHESRWANVQEFVNLAAEFMRDKSRSDEEEALPVVQGIEQNVEDDMLARFLANVSLASDKQSDDKDGKGKPLVTISTIHAAKGLEWPVVFIPAVYQGSIPHMRSDDSAEERRLLYVAMTRAKALLYLSLPLHVSAGGAGNGDGGTQLSPFVDSLSLTNFLKKGPSFDRQMMTEISKILRRELPSEQAIYKNMPLMASIEDNLFPVDPRQAQAEASGGGGGVAQTTAMNKRRKLQHAASGNSQIDTDSVDGWSGPYATTMQRSSSFTVPQAGFTTAAAHHASATAAAEKKPPARLPQRGPKMPPGPQRPVQRSLLGYGYGVTNHDRSKTADEAPGPATTAAALPPHSSRGQPPPPWKNRQRGRQQQQRPLPSLAAAKPPAEPAIEPSLAGHKLGTARLARPTAAARADGDEDAAAAAGALQKQYACFSSPPSKAATAEQAGAVGKENAVPAEERVGEEEKVRPAASFHATTVTGPLGGQGRGLGIKRPAPLAALGRGGIAPMDRLKKPFKLTVKRP